jgi:hypothetical protein
MGQYDLGDHYVNIKLQDKMKGQPYLDEKGHSYGRTARHFQEAKRYRHD